MTVLNLIEVFLILVVMVLLVGPYLGYWRSQKTFTGVVNEMGIGYAEILYKAARERLVECLGTLTLLLFFASVFVYLAVVLIVMSFYLTVMVHLAIRKGHVVGSIVGHA